MTAVFIVPLLVFLDYAFGDMFLDESTSVDPLYGPPPSGHFQGSSSSDSDDEEKATTCEELCQMMGR